MPKTKANTHNFIFNFRPLDEGLFYSLLPKGMKQFLDGWEITNRCKGGDERRNAIMELIRSKMKNTRRMPKDIMGYEEIGEIISVRYYFYHIPEGRVGRWINAIKRDAEKHEGLEFEWVMSGQDNRTQYDFPSDEDPTKWRVMPTDHWVGYDAYPSYEDSGERPPSKIETLTVDGKPCIGISRPIVSPNAPKYHMTTPLKVECPDGDPEDETRPIDAETKVSGGWMASRTAKDFRRGDPCVLCDDEVVGYGNNPQPLKEDGRCCDTCNSTKVIPERLKRNSIGMGYTEDGENVLIKDPTTGRCVYITKEELKKYIDAEKGEEWLDEPIPEDNFKYNGECVCPKTGDGYDYPCQCDEHGPID